MTYLCQSLPLILRLLGKSSPLLPDDLGDGRVRNIRMLSYDRGLIVLTIEYKGYRKRLWEQALEETTKKNLHNLDLKNSPLRGLGILGSG